jgi:hypothetical protein
MEATAVGYLYTLAVIGTSFAGFAVLTMIFRQVLGGHMTKFDGFVTRSWIELVFMTTLGSILPPLLALFDIPAATHWRASSGIMAVILGWWALTFPRRRHAVNPTRLPRFVVGFVAAMDFVAFALAANAIVVSAERLVGIYAVAVTAILIGAGILFIFTLIHWYEVSLDPNPPNPKS